MDLAGLSVTGISVGGIETCLVVSSLKLAFDMGSCQASAIAQPTVLFTHAHVDHMAGVIWHAAMRSLRRLPPPRYVVPRENHAAFLDLLAVWRRLDRSDLACEVLPLAPGEELELGSSWSVRAFRSPHRVHCQGYALYQERSTLKAPFRALPESEIRRLRVDEGIQVTEAVRSCELAFTGDTLIEVVEQEEAVRRARRLLIEVTFLDDRVSVEEARSKGHVHLYEVAERAALFENEAIGMTHFSSRYKPHEIVAALDKTLPADLRQRVVPFLDGRR
jgi:ribonuclease Z